MDPVRTSVWLDMRGVELLNNTRNFMSIKKALKAIDSVGEWDLGEQLL